MKIFYNFPNLDSYNECYKIIDKFAERISKNRNRLHKIGKEKYYMTTAFNNNFPKHFVLQHNFYVQL